MCFDSLLLNQLLILFDYLQHKINQFAFFAINLLSPVIVTIPAP
jgi:hypothetical protein